MVSLGSPSAAEGGARLRHPANEREAGALAAVRDVALDSGLDAGGAGIWRAGSAVLVGLPRARVLGRVDPIERLPSALRQVVVSEVLAEVGVPAVTLTGPFDQPVETDAGAVTIWVWLDALERVEVPPRALGHLARTLHDATRGGVPDVPDFDPLAAVALELDRAEALGRTRPADLAMLRERMASLAEAWPRPEDDPLGVAIVHGDLHRHNAVPTATGPVLADLELAGNGPVCADLVPHVIAVRRYGAPPHVLDEFLAGYGLEASGWRGFEVLLRGYELWVTAWAVSNRTESADHEAEAEVRLDRWRPGRIAVRPWSLR